MNKLIIIGFSLLCLQVSAQCHLTLGEAKAVIQAAYNFARQNYSNEAYTFVVFDINANIKALARMDGCTIGPLNVAQKKARFSAHFGLSTGDFSRLKYNLPESPLYRIELTDGTFETIPGGIPLFSNGTLCGSVGVSGAFDPSHDENIAKAGAAVFGQSTEQPLDFHDQKGIDFGISLQEAADRAEAAIETAYQIATIQGISILDHYSHLKLMYVMDGAVSCVYDLAIRKATSTMLFGIPSASVQDFIQPSSPYFTIDNIKGVTGLPGAFPIVTASGIVVGAIGASGDVNPAKDAQCAQSGAYISNVNPSQIPSITLPQALAAIQNALQTSDGAGYWGAAAVIDLAGRLVALYRMDGVEPGVIDLILKKANTALYFGVDNSVLFNFVRPSTPAYTLEWTGDGLVIFDGASPILDPTSKKVIGAIGVFTKSFDQSLENNMAHWAAANVSAGATVNTVKIPVFNPNHGDFTYAGDDATLEALQAGVEASLQAASTYNRPVAISAYDASGNLKIFVRQDGIQSIAIDISQKVGQYSYLFPIESDSFQQFLDPTTGSWYTTQNSNGGLVAIAGGVPAISTKNRVMGSFGVSGGIGATGIDKNIATVGTAAFLAAN